MILALVGPALASSVAVLPLDGRGVSGEQAAAATEVLRDTLGLEGVEVPLATEVAGALTAGHEEELESARARYAEGRASLTKGRAAEAVRALDESARLHLTAGSSWSRRTELADVAWSLAEARLAVGDSLAAREDLTALATFWPAYAASHPTVKGTAARMLSEVDSGVARTTWAPPDEATLAGLLGALGTDALVVGSVGGQGAVHLLVYRAGGEREELDADVELPVNPAALEWEAVAGRVAGLVRPAPAATPRSNPGPAREPEEVERDRPPEGTVARPGREAPVRIKTGRTVRPAEGPITNRWWFWVGLLALVGGGTTAVVVAAQPAPVVTTYEEPVWTLVVTPP